MNKEREEASFKESINKRKYAFLAENLNDAVLSTWDTDGIFFCVDNSATYV